MNITEKQIEELQEIAHQSAIYTELDWEFNLDGNGLSAEDVMRTMEYVMRILQIEIPEVTEEDLSKAEDENQIEE